MKKTLFLCLALTGSSMAGITSDSPAGHDSIFQLEQQPLTGEVLDIAPAQLCDVASNTQAYLSRGTAYDPHAIHGGQFGQLEVNLERVTATLAFICQVHQEDQQQQRPSRLTDAAFISTHFDIIRWRPDHRQIKAYSANKPLLQRIPEDEILLTKYYVKQASGNSHPTPQTPHALYAIPHDEQHLTLEQADAVKESLTRYRYTKHQVLTGVLDKKQLATPHIWLSRKDLEDTLMQGTVKINSPSGSRFYNVHRNNGHAYDRNINKEQQKRYWYFKQTRGVMGYGKDADEKINIHPKVTVAGDLKQLGLGKLILLSHQNQHRLAILADTGGAFENNRYQLDYLAGYYTGWGDYHRAWKNTPDYFQARILLLKQQG